MGGRPRVARRTHKKHEKRRRSNEHQGDMPASSSNSKLAGAKAIQILTKIEDKGSLACGLNCYGAAIAIPQIARSAGWSWTLLGISLQTYFHLLLNYVCQGFVLCMVGLEMHVMFPLAGKMHLCDFGANIPECPAGPNCKGPGGTALSFSRLYGFGVWNTRTFVRNALEALLPNHTDTINAKVDPGEYGLENYWIRALCIGFFTMATLPDLENNIELLRMLYVLPTKAEEWIVYNAPEWERKASVKKRHCKTELNFVIFQIAGIPLHWKLFNLLAVLLPKCFIWWVMARHGIHYLMETAGIIDVIVNSLALTFVLSIDEMLFQHLSSQTTQHMMTSLQSFPLFEIASAEMESDEVALSNYTEEELACGAWTKAVKAFIPWQLVKVLALQLLFLGMYYGRNCDRTEDGSWVSKPIANPSHSGFSIWASLFGDVVVESEPTWTMPG